MDFVGKKLLDYCISHSSKESEILKELNRQTHIRTLNPRMICGRHQGRFLSMVSKIIRPKRILEIGTFTGYSTLCLAEGLETQGTIDTIDNNFELKKIQNYFFNLSRLQNQIRQFTCDAIDILPMLKDKYDLIFLDADKRNYLNYLNFIIPLLRKKGVLISDNVLWSGKVVKADHNGDLETQVLKKFNQKLSNHKDLETVLLPIRDGISISMKV
tara:strand:+ start:709 stop:1350 length:642 start_codon:yes stop_codon:yes gene_type:complete